MEQLKTCSLKQRQWGNIEEVISLLDVVKNAKPTVLIGVSGQPGLFTEEIIKTMAAN
ncbi:hypothetical protein FKN07_19390, partial [Proteus mirabilis]